MHYFIKTIREKFTDRRLIAFGAAIFVIMNIYQSPMREYAAGMRYPVSFYTLPFLLAEHTFLILVFFCVIYANADIPFMQSYQLYTVIRIGRKRWAWGQICGIIVRSFSMMLILWICSVITLLPSIEMGTEWGKLLKTAAYTDAASVYEFNYMIYSETMEGFTPLQLMGLVILLGTLILSALGIMMFLISLYTNRVVSITSALAISFFMFWVLNTLPMVRYRIARYVPTVWLEIAKLYTRDVLYYWLPSVRYMLTVLVGLILCFSALIIFRIRTVEFDWKNEDA